MKKGLPRFLLWKEIIWVLIFKGTVIFAIWYFFFSDPIEKHLTRDKVAHQLLCPKTKKPSTVL